jgi:hypothetical protein
VSEPVKPEMGVEYESQKSVFLHGGPTSGGEFDETSVLAGVFC